MSVVAVAGKWTYTWRHEDCWTPADKPNCASTNSWWQNFYNNFVNCNRFEKHILRMEHCFTASMTAHTISILSQLKMSPFDPYAGAMTHSPSIALSTALCWRPCQMSNSSSTSWTRDWYRRCWTRQKVSKIMCFFIFIFLNGGVDSFVIKEWQSSCNIFKTYMFYTVVQRGF